MIAAGATLGFLVIVSLLAAILGSPSDQTELVADRGHPSLFMVFAWSLAAQIVKWTGWAVGDVAVPTTSWIGWLAYSATDGLIRLVFLFGRLLGLIVQTVVGWMVGLFVAGTRQLCLAVPEYAALGLCDL